MKLQTMLLTFILSINSAYSANRFDTVVDNNDSVKLKINTNEAFYKKIISGITDTIPTVINIPTTILDGEGETTSQISEGQINLGTSAADLFTLTPIGLNKVLIKWNLKNLSAFFHIRLDYQTTILGADFKKHYDINVTASSIRNAETEVEFSFNQSLLKIDKITNRNFAINDISGFSSNDTVLNWLLGQTKPLFEIVINSMIASEIQSGDLINKLTADLNEKFKDLNDISVKMNDYGTRFSVLPKFLNVNTNTIDFGVKATFNNENLVVHECNRQMVKNSYNSPVDLSPIAPIKSNFNTLAISHGFIEQLILNISTYEKDEDGDGLIDEPTFCFGYKNGKSEGKVEQINFNFLNKERHIDIKFWGIPLEQPKFSYEKDLSSDDYMIVAKMKFNLKFEELDNNPKLIFKDDVANMAFTAKFKLKKVLTKGQVLDLQSLSLDDFDGSIKVKIAKGIPGVHIPFGLIKNSLETKLAEALREDLQSEVLINEKMDAFGFNIILDQIKIMQDNFMINFKYE